MKQKAKQHAIQQVRKEQEENTEPEYTRIRRNRKLDINIANGVDN